MAKTDDQLKALGFNPTAGIPKTSYGPNSSPGYDTVTWFSTIQPPKKEQEKNGK